MYDAIIIGGGAAGLFLAANAKGRTLVVEARHEVGVKILKTGNGRCNISNKYVNAALYSNDKKKRLFLQQVFNTYSNKDTLSFFKDRGLATTDIGDLIYPRSMTASSVRNILLRSAVENKADILTDASCIDINKKDGIFYVTCEVKKEIDKKPESVVYKAPHVVITTGGESSVPRNERRLSGYKLAESLGHTDISHIPALTALEVNDPYIRIAKGVRAKAKINIIDNNKIIRTESGEIQMCDYGISGIAVFQTSGEVGRKLKALDRGKNEFLKARINFLPDYEGKEAEELAGYWGGKYPDRTLKGLLCGLLNAKLVEMLAARLKYFSDKKIKNLPEAAKDIVRESMNMDLQISGVKGFDMAQVTSGGIATGEIDPETMESKLCKGLYFAGEVVDVDGPCGGYNLQWAWSSAGVAAAAIG